jgi:protein-serine/threonine kinase
MSPRIKTATRTTSLRIRVLVISSHTYHARPLVSTVPDLDILSMSILLPSKMLTQSASMICLEYFIRYCKLTLDRSPIIPEHGGEHGLGLSGLRRIRQQPLSSVQVEFDNGIPTAPASRSASMSLSPNISRRPSATTGVSGVSPNMSAIEDLNRFPSESLHSFSFTHQSDESIQNRQNVLKRSMDFMRDKLGWAASNPGLVAAQARLSGDQEVQSMVELLNRANLIGEDANHAHGLGAPAPVTGPADIASNVFDESFAGARPERPNHIDEVPPKEFLQEADNVLNSLAQKTEESITIIGETTLNALTKALADTDLDSDVISTKSRAQLKRTLTNTDELSLQNRLTETLAQPYSVNEQTPPNLPASLRKYNTLPPINSSGQIGPQLNHPHSAAPHGHGSRWAPVAQAIFTTEANAPWTITAANDLACLVFGVTNAEVRKLGILEVVKEERRKWLEEKLKDPEGGSMRGKTPYSHSQRPSPDSTTSLNVGNGLTARLLSKPPSRYNGQSSKKRSQTDDGVGSSYASRNKSKGGSHHTQHKSRGVLLCGDVVPIRKRNGDLGSASLWVKEKKGGLIWVLEEIVEDVAFIELDEVGCVVKANGAIEDIWGTERIRRGMDIKRIIPAIPRVTGTNTGALDIASISDIRTFTARAVNDISIPITIEYLADSFRVSSFPHIAGIMVLNSLSLHVTSSNTVFSAALFGQEAPEGLHVNDILPGFDGLLHLMTDEDKIKLVDGIVIPEHSFRRARALLAMREGRSDAAAVFLRPTGLLARHRDGSDIMVDVQMRVVKSERSHLEEDVIDEMDEYLASGDSASHIPTTEVVYALWITYSRHLHTSHTKDGAISMRPIKSPTPCQQPTSGQLETVPGLGITTELPESPSNAIKPVSLLTTQLKGSSATESTSTDPGSAKSSASSNITGVTSPLSPSPTTTTNSRKKAINDFVVLEDMGQGAYGQVKLCRYKRLPGNKMVIKYVTKKRILVDTWTRDRRLGTVPLEIHVLDYLQRPDLKHPNVVEMSDFFEDDVNYYIEMVPHGLPGMDLFDYIELRSNMEEDEARRIFVQVAEAVYHLHIRAKVVHRDIKDENVILDGDQNIKLIDFGSAAYIKNGPFDVFVGTIGMCYTFCLSSFIFHLLKSSLLTDFTLDYAAPEVLAGNPYRGKEQDVWALGILLYTIIYKENPFYSIDEIMDHDLRVPYVMSEASIDLVRRMLNRDVDRRISIGEVLEHRWCKGVGAESEGEGGAVP